MASAKSSAWTRSGPAAAVLVGLDLHERGLRRAAQTGDRPGVRIGLLELVGRAVHERTRGPARASPRPSTKRDSDGPSSASAIARSARSMSPGSAGAAGDGHGRTQRRLEGRLQAGAQAQQARVPLPALVDPGQPAVVQLVAEVERELQVVVRQRVVGRARAAAGGRRATRAGRRAGGPGARRRADHALRGERAWRPRGTPPAGSPSQSGAPARALRRASPPGSARPASAATAAAPPPSAATRRWRSAPLTATRRTCARRAPPRSRRGPRRGPSSSSSASSRSRGRARSAVTTSASSPSTPCRHADQRFSSMRQVSAARGRVLAVAAAARWATRAWTTARDRGGVGHRRLRVGDADLDGAVLDVQPQLPPPLGRRRHRTRGHAPAQRLGVGLQRRQRGRDALAREQAAQQRADGGHARVAPRPRKAPLAPSAASSGRRARRPL